MTVDLDAIRARLERGAAGVVDESRYGLFVTFGGLGCSVDVDDAIWDCGAVTEGDEDCVERVSEARSLAEFLARAWGDIAALFALVDQQAARIAELERGCRCCAGSQSLKGADDAD